MKYVLRKPIAFGDAPQITELVFREEICAGDMRGVKFSALGDPTPEELFRVGARLCGQPEPVLMKMGPYDTFKVAEIIGGFLLDGLKTGSEPSPS